MALVILAHPDFSRSIANKAVITRLQHSGLSLEIRDLAALYPDYRIDPTAEQQALLRHHTVLFQFPLYWYNVPAILKQYFDCVLTYGFAYGTGGDQLRGKNFVASITIGAPADECRVLSLHQCHRFFAEASDSCPVLRSEQAFFHHPRASAGNDVFDGEVVADVFRVDTAGRHDFQHSVGCE